MAANSNANPNTNTNATTADTLVSIKVAIDNAHRRFKVPLRDLGAQIFHAKVGARATRIRSFRDLEADQI